MNELDILAADAKLAHSRRDIMRHQSFFATMLLSMSPKYIEEGTMAVDGTYLYICREFVLKQCGQAMVTFVLLHECLHVILKHHLRRGNRDPELWNVACDYVVNSIITHMGALTNSGSRPFTVKEFKAQSGDYFRSRFSTYTRPEYKMPQDGLLEPKYLGMSVEDVYADIVKTQPDDGNDGNDDGNDGNDDGNNGSGQGDSGQGNGNKPKAPDWGRVEDAINGDGEALTADDIKEAEKEIDQLVTTAENISKGRGDMPGTLSEAIAANNEASQEWSDVLKEILVEQNPCDFSFNKLNRMYGVLGGILPSVEKDGMGPIAIFADASGSVSPKEFNQFMSDINIICEDLMPESVTLVQFDSFAATHETVEQGDAPEQVRLRHGGTDFRAPFNYCEKNDLLDDFAAIIVFTDGGDNHYANEPDCPVIWASTGAFWQGDPPYGQIVNVKFT